MIKASSAEGGRALMDRRQQAREAMAGVLRHFMPQRQLAAMQELSECGEEADFFIEKVIEYRDRIQGMPIYREQEELGDEAVAFLHYCRWGFHFYIIGRDSAGNGAAEVQERAFGLVIPDAGEQQLGCISLPEIFSSGADLDLHFEPRSLAAVKAERAAFRL